MTEEKYLALEKRVEHLEHLLFRGAKIASRVRTAFDNAYLPTMDEITEVVCNRTGVSIEAVRINGRQRKFADTKQVLMYFLHIKGGYILTEVAKHLHLKHHTTILNGADNVRTALEGYFTFKTVSSKTLRDINSVLDAMIEDRKKQSELAGLVKEEK